MSARKEVTRIILPYNKVLELSKHTHKSSTTTIIGRTEFALVFYVFVWKTHNLQSFFFVVLKRMEGGGTEEFLI